MTTTTAAPYENLDAWIDAHFDEEVRFLQELVRVPTDTPPGNNAPHAERTAELLQGFGFVAERHVADVVERANRVAVFNLSTQRDSRRGGDGGDACFSFAVARRHRPRFQFPIHIYPVSNSQPPW